MVATVGGVSAMYTSPRDMLQTPCQKEVEGHDVDDDVCVPLAMASVLLTWSGGVVSRDDYHLSLVIYVAKMFSAIPNQVTPTLVKFGQVSTLSPIEPRSKVWPWTCM